MKIQSCNNIYFNSYNVKYPDKHFIIPSANNYNICSNNSYQIFLPSFKATNVELISKMEIALKENKQQEIIKLFEQMSDTVHNNVKSVVKKFKSNGLTLDNYLPACVKQKTLFYRNHETIEKNINDIVEIFTANGLG